MDTKEYIKQVMSENNERLKSYIQQQATNSSSDLTELRRQNQLLQQEIDSLNNILDNINRESV
jgi:hypothetical protein